MSPEAAFDEQVQILKGFIEEGAEMLDDVEPLLVELEKNFDRTGVVDNELINTIFRLFHSLKGGAAFLELKVINRVTHKAETLLDLFRKGKAILESEHVDLIIRVCDFLRAALAAVDQSSSDRSMNAEADNIVADLEQLISSLTKDSAYNIVPEPFSTTIIPDSALETSHPINSPFVAEPIPTAASLPSLEISEEMIKAFRTEADDLLESAEQSLLILEKEPSAGEYVQQAFRAFHSFKGNAGFLGYADLERLSHCAENAMDAVRTNFIKGDSRFFDLLLKLIDFLRQGLSRLDSGKNPAIPATPGLLSLIDDAIAKNKLAASPTIAVTPQSNSSPVDDSVAIFQETTEKELERIDAERRQIAFDRRQEHRRHEALEAAGRVTADQSARGSDKQSVRVDVAKLDILLDLVGELVIAEAMVAQNPDVKNLDVKLDRFERAVMQLDKITRELQNVVTSVRMIPLAGTFKRMIRLVRDLSQKAGKDVDLALVGEDTEVDKSVIELISDPLVHIIRNSIDHGVDTAFEREKLGKKPTAKLSLEAKYVGSEVWIMISDDGRGLNRDKILAKARERGLLEGDGADLKDEAVWQFIFLPGFSTADKVTDVSGRGVGMDVVRRNIEAIRGKVEVRSQTGAGTMIILKIPLTLAIIDGMIARVGTTLFTIQTIEIRQSIRPTADQIVRTMDGRQIVNLRGTLMPVVDLAQRYNVRTSRQSLDQAILIVIESGGHPVCLAVDELLGQQQIVIKALSNYVGDLTGISGCTILGGGEISLILDTASLIASLEQQSEA